MKKIRMLTPGCLVVMLSLCVSGCGGNPQLIRELPEANLPTPPTDGKALIVFFRPASDLTFNNYVRANVVEVQKVLPDLELIGILSADPNAGTRIAYRTEPGTHLFMVIGENADFLDADVLPNKTYYVEVTPQPGRYKAHFSFRAINSREFGSRDIRKSIDSCKWTEKTPAADRWMLDNMVSIRAKQTQFYSLWTQKPEAERSKILREDSVETSPR